MKKYRLVWLLLSTCATTTAIAQNADSASYYHQQGITEQQARRFREAEKHFAKSDQFGHGNTANLVEWGNVLVAQNRYMEAREKFLEAEKKDPENPVIIENLATLSINARKWPEAVKYAQLMQAKKIGTKPVNFIIAKAYYEMENYGEALKYCERAFRDDSTKAEVPYIAGRCFVEMSNYKRAEGCYQQAIARDPKNFNWMFEAGMVAYAIPDDKKAVYWFEMAAEKGYKRTDVYLENLANAYVNMKEYEKGIPLLKTVLEHRPHDAELIYNVGDAYYRNKQYQDAIDTWDKLLVIDKKNMNALYMIGMAYQKKGDTAKGEQLCNQAIALDPSLKDLRQEKKMPGGR
ncbi:tetratricopeptide repeat protein [Paraflavitalea pollutisoli]|uniref:tetratricopeptide repeat protein n=1 Tax=Paraflavitalea pollutisoli TaxID=3034143 RepID=UPI0023EDC0DC|nr:tetratricopeptide repeat protein [Paraflavitalea sp. H1-2-19X]